MVFGRTYVIGDSHALYSFGRIIEVEIHWLGPITMHRIGGDGCDSLPLPGSMGAGDNCVFVSGEIDIRCHVGRIADLRGEKVEDVIHDLVDGYTQEIDRFSKRRGIEKTIVFGCPPPADHEDSPEFPIYGDLATRAINTRLINQEMKTRCEQLGLIFLQIPRAYITGDGVLRRNLSDGVVHIAPSCSKAVCTSLSKALGRPMTFHQDELSVRLVEFLKRRVPGLNSTAKLRKMSPNPIEEIRRRRGEL